MFRVARRVKLAWRPAAAWREIVENIVSIKEAGGSPERVSALKKILPPEFTILSGDDGLTLPFMAVGAVGVVSVASNVIPRQITDMVNAFLAGRSADALKLHLRYFQLFKDLFIESNPIPVKTALVFDGNDRKRVSSAAMRNWVKPTKANSTRRWLP